MSKISEEQAAEILRESMERMSPIRQKLDAHCRAVEQRINRAKDPYVRIEELEMANEHCHEAMQKQAERIVDLEAELARIHRHDHIAELQARIREVESALNGVEAKLAEYLERLLQGRTLPNRWVGEINDIVQAAKATATQRQVVHAANCPVGGNFACTCGADFTSPKSP